MKKCFTSIEKQTYQDWRAIIVDDGSNEETKNFIDDYIRNHTRFLVRYVTNGGYLERET